ncbi:hypothetical protein ABEY69_03785 [Priestia filamentosa]
MKRKVLDGEKGMKHTLKDALRLRKEGKLAKMLLSLLKEHKLIKKI